MLWLKFWGGQAVQLLAMVLGWVVLIPVCLAKAWKPGEKSIKDWREIDLWKWEWLNYFCGNPEDGVSGGQALINGNQPYMPNAWFDAWRAYCWSAWRNSCDNLKYVFSIPGNGPMKYVGPFKFGYQTENGYNVPVVGLK